MKDLGENYDLRPAIITQGMKLFMTFIDRIGFPILVALLMWYQNIVSIRTINALNQTMTKQTVILNILMDRLGVKVVHDATPAQEKP